MVVLGHKRTAIADADLVLFSGGNEGLAARLLDTLEDVAALTGDMVMVVLGLMGWRNHEVVTFVDESTVDTRTGPHLLPKVPVLDSLGAFGELTTPCGLGAIEGPGDFAVDLLVTRAVGAEWRHARPILDVRFEVLLARDALEVRLGILADDSSARLMLPKLAVSGVLGGTEARRHHVPSLLRSSVFGGVVGRRFGGEVLC